MTRTIKILSLLLLTMVGAGQAWADGTFTITWKDGDGKTLKTDEVAYGETPSYSGATPTKTATDQYTYTFNNTWSPEIEDVTGPATYTAQFDAVLITSGYCGTTGSVESVTWSYNTETKALSISGTGYMMYYNSVQNPDESYSNGAPWKHFADEIVSVTIGNGITYVGSNTFAHCPNISNVTLPTSGIYQIGDGVFADCTSLESIDIPMSINNIGNQAFAGCGNLKTVSIGYGNPGTFTLGSDVFPATTTILVPENAYNDYVKEKAVNGESVEIDNPFYGYKDKIRPATLTFFAANATHTWSTFCAQDDYTLPEGCTAYTMASVSNGTVTLSPVDGSTISAYTPVLIKRTEGDVTEAIKATFAAVGTSSNALASSEVSDYTLWGNASDAAITEGGFTGLTAYSLYNGKFYRYEGTQAIAAHRCLLTLSPVYTAPKMLTIGETTSLSPIPSPSREGGCQAWYSLDGRKIANGQKPKAKGIYINKGVKVVVK